jgi:F-type H+-transporting ATPase subunit delta
MIAPSAKDIPPRTTAVGETYAKALLPLAVQHGEARSMLQELERAAALLAEVQDFATWIAHPGVPLQEKIDLVEKAFRHHISDLTCDALVVTCRHGRLVHLGEIVQSFRRRLEESEGRIRVQVVAATPLEDQARRELEAVLAERLARLPILEVDVDPEILGGLIVQAGDQRLDLSVQCHIEQLRAALHRKTSQAVAAQAAGRKA